MIKEKPKGRSWARRWWQAAFVLLFVGVIAFETVPEVRASTVYLLTDGLYTMVSGGARLDDRIVYTGAGADGSVLLEPDRRVTIRRGGMEQYATSREGESAAELLAREGVAVGPLELVRVDLSGDEALLEIGSDFTYYETVAEAAAFRTVYEPDPTLPKGETRVEQAGQPGWHEVTYEVVYADGAFVSRQAVAESNDTSVSEVVRVGTLVTEAQQGDTIASVLTNDDGSGYLILSSGDSLHFTGTMNIRCTAYNKDEPGLGELTFSETPVHVGVVAVDRSVIPLGTWMFITTLDGSYTYGMSHAEDTGVRGNTVDLYMDSIPECIQFGVRSSIAYFLDK